MWNLVGYYNEWSMSGGFQVIRLGILVILYCQLGYHQKKNYSLMFLQNQIRESSYLKNSSLKNISSCYRHQTISSFIQKSTIYFFPTLLDIIIFEMTNQYFRGQFNGDHLVTVIAILLQSVIDELDSSQGPPSHFDIKGSVNMKLDQYLKRIYKFMNCSKSCFIMALILLDRFQEKNPEFYVSRKNIHKLTMVSVMIATKSNEDTVYKNTYYSKISGFKLQQLNSLERTFLEMIQFQSLISPKVYEQYATKIAEYIQTNSQSLPNSSTKIDINKNQVAKVGVVQNY